MSNWYVIELKERYSKETARKEFYEKLKSFYEKKSEDIFICLGSESNGLNYYVFIKDDNIKVLWEKFKNDKYIDLNFGYYPITEQEMKEMKKGLDGIREEICFGDIVKIKGGKYNKLNGIVLREREDNKYEIGLKFCYGIRTTINKGKDLEIVGNIFNFIKIKK